jgi:MFS superfamily sulfate permease-like transporter
MVQWTDLTTILATFFSQQLRDRLYLDCKVNRFDTIIMVAVFAIDVFLDAALAAIVGIVMVVFEYAWECSTRISIEREKGDNDNVVSYRIKGNIFFASANKLVYGISSESIAEDPREIIILMKDGEIGLACLRSRNGMKVYNQVERTLLSHLLHHGQNL